VNRKNTFWANGLICGTATGFWILVFLLSDWTASDEFYSPLFTLEHISEDFRTRYGRQAEASPQLVFLGVDKQIYSDEVWPEEMEDSEALQLIAGSQFPWSRKIYALVAERLIESGARLVIFDFIFPHEDEGDAAFRERIRAYPDRIILGANFDVQTIANQDGVGFRSTQIWPSESILGDLEKTTDQVGLVNFPQDYDQTVRRLNFNFSIPESRERLPTLLTQSLKKLGVDDPRLNSAWSYRFRFAGPPQSAFRFRPIYEIFVPSLWEANYDNGVFFRDKIVMVGPAANWTLDLHQTPFDQQMFGPEVHLNALNAVLQDELVREPGLGLSSLLILGHGLLAFGIVHWTASPLMRTLGFIFASGASLLLSWVCYNEFSVMILTITPLLALNTSGAACMVDQFIRESLERARTRSTFEQYVSQNVVQQMLDSEEFQKVLKGVRLPCTIFFSDIRGFTTLAENSDSHQLVAQLNEYFTEMVDCVFRHNGTLDKFIGDAVMAVWGNTASRGASRDAIDAVTASLEMLDSVRNLNKSWKERGLPELAIGIGLNHGEVIVGDMGSPKKKEFTVIGDAVNLASRLEGTTKTYGLQLVLGENVAELVGNAFVLQKVDLIRVKGKSCPVQSYTCFRPHDLNSTELDALATYHRGLDYFLNRKFEQAEAALLETEKVFPHNSLATLYLKRCRHLMKDPPPEDWDGVVTLTTK